MRRLATKYQVPLHLDGARLWEIAPYYKAEAGSSLREVVALFDSAYVSFYKGMGAPFAGAMLLGSESFIEAASPWRRRLGANPWTVMPYALSCRDAFHRHSHTFEARWHKAQRLVPLLSAAAAAEGGSFRTSPAEPTCCQAHVRIGCGAGCGEGLDKAAMVAALDAARDSVEAALGVRVYNRLVGTVANGGGQRDEASDPPEWWFEWTLGPAHVEMEDETFIEAWAAFFRALRTRELPVAADEPQVEVKVLEAKGNKQQAKREAGKGVCSVEGRARAPPLKVVDD